MRFSIYRSYTAIVLNLLRKKISGSDMELWRKIAARHKTVHGHTYAESIQVYQAADDFRYRKSGCPTIFIESPALATALIGAELSNIGLDSFEIPFGGCFSIAVPPLKYNGVDLSGFLVSVHATLESQLKLIEDHLRAVIGHKAIDVKRDGPNEGRMCVHVPVHTAARARRGDIEINTVETGISKIARMCSGLEGWDSCANYSSNRERINNEPERIQQIASMRLAIGAMIYMKAFPNALVRGIPDGADRTDCSDSRPSRVRTLRLPEEFRNSPNPHLRRWHFRTLRDERYKRNEDGTPRTIFVKEAVVNGREAHTLTGDKAR